RGSTATILPVGVPGAAPRPPMTNAVVPIAAAAAWVVAAGKLPTRLTLPVAGANAYTPVPAAPCSSDPPATTIRPSTAVAAAVQNGRRAVERRRHPAEALRAGAGRRDDLVRRDVSGRQPAEQHGTSRVGRGGRILNRSREIAGRDRHQASNRGRCRPRNRI